MKWRISHSGQNIVVEEVLVFGIGLVLALGLFTTFQTFGSQAQKEATEEKLSTVGSYLRAKIIQTTRLQGDGRLSISLPGEVSGTAYFVSLNDTQLQIISEEDESHALQLHGLSSSYTLQGQVQSAAERVFIQKTANNISLGSA